MDQKDDKPCLYFIRHASPDWGRTDIPYLIPPGPPLSPKGEKEAEALATFLKAQGVVKLYHSPFERTARTAKIASSINQIPCIEEVGLSEWHAADEAENLVGKRMLSVLSQIERESMLIGPIGLVSHGGPVAVLLRELGMDMEELASYKKQFDHSNPLPPAGAWEAEWNREKRSWNLNLKFIPCVS